MAKNVSPLDSLQWFEGMLLTPQALQQQDRYNESIRNYLMQYVHPFFYGVREIDIDEAKLAAGLFQVTRIRAMFQDGLPFEITDASNDDLSIQLKPHQAAFSKGPQTISLAVPTYKPMESNATGDYPRYRSVDGDKAVDLNTGDNVIDFPRLRGNVVLIVGDVPARYTSFPIAQVQLDQDTYVFADNFSPPYVQLTQDLAISKLVFGLISTMRGKVNFLYQKQSAYESSYGTQALGEKNLGPILELLSSCLLELEAHYYTNAMDPYKLYVCLCNLAGRLAPLKPSQLLPFFGAYRHLDQYATFSKPINFIRQMLQLLQQDFKAIVFQQKDRLFTLQLDQSWTRGQTMLYLGLKLSSTLTKSEALAWLNEAVIATEDKVQNIREKRVLGAPRKVIEAGVETTIAIAQDIILIGVENNADFITPGGVLNIFNISDAQLSRPQEVILYVMELQDAPSDDAHTNTTQSS